MWEPFFNRVSKSAQVIAIDQIVIRSSRRPGFNATIDAECTATTFVLDESAPTPIGAESQS